MRRIYKSVFSFLIITIIIISLGGQKASAAFNVDLPIRCDAIYMVNMETGVVAFEKNAEARKYPASLTKIMTALLALEYYPDPTAATVTIDRSVMSEPELTSQCISTTMLKEGEQVNLKDLLYCVMTRSDNYAALAVAHHVSGAFGDGSIEWFVARMNQRAAELGCTGTNFANPHGLFNENHYTTAIDMYRISACAMRIPFFADMVDESTYIRPATNMSPENIKFYTRNKMMLSGETKYYNKFVKGIKTGYIEAAGHCVVSYAVKDGYSYIVVALDDGAKIDSAENGAFIDSNTLFNWAFEKLTLCEIVRYDTLVAEVPLELAWDKDVLLLVPAESFRTLLPSNVGASSVYITLDTPESVKAPIERGEHIGTAYFTYGGLTIGSVELVSGEAVERSSVLMVLDTISSIFTSTAFKLIIISLVLIVALYIAYTFLIDRIRRSSGQVYRKGGKKKKKRSRNSVRRHR